MPALARLLSIPAQQVGSVLFESWGAFRRSSAYADVPPLDPSLRTVAEAILDRTFTLFTSVMTGVPRPEAVRRMVAEAEEIRDLFRERGWLADPATYHRDPPPVESFRSTPAATWDRTGRRRFRHLVFESGYEPHEGEPGRDRWLAFEANRTAHAYVLEHEGPPRPWLVCVHGFAMGTPLVNFSAFQVKRLHDELGLNLVFPCLPLHGPRGTSRFSGADVLAPDFVNIVHLLAQASWDIRRTVSWVRSRQPTGVGLYGVSLGAYTSALAASLEDGIDCIFASIPAVDFPGLARDNQPWIMDRYDEEFDIDWSLVRAVTHVVSPLAMQPRVPHHGRFIIAGVADRVVRPDQPRALWRHWEHPRIHWFDGGHVVGQFNSSIADFLEISLRELGMLARP